MSSDDAVVGHVLGSDGVTSVKFGRDGSAIRNLDPFTLNAGDVLLFCSAIGVVNLRTHETLDFVYDVTNWLD